MFVQTGIFISFRTLFILMYGDKKPSNDLRLHKYKNIYEEMYKFLIIKMTK